MQGFTGEQLSFFHAAKTSRADDLLAALDSGAEVDKLDSTGRSALTNAIDARSWPIVEALLKRGANANIIDPWNQTPLHSMIINFGISGQTDPAPLANLLAHGAKLDAVVPGCGDSALHLGAISGTKPEIMDFLLGNGLAIDRPNAHQSTPLHLAALHGDTDMIAYLLSRGASASAVDNQGKTPKMIALENGEPTVAAAIDAWLAQQAIAGVISKAAATQGGCAP
jgi:ankyrin repeat protein